MQIYVNQVILQQLISKPNIPNYGRGYLLAQQCTFICDLTDPKDAFVEIVSYMNYVIK